MNRRYYTSLAITLGLLICSSAQAEEFEFLVGDEDVTSLVSAFGVDPISLRITGDGVPNCVLHGGEDSDSCGCASDRFGPRWTARASAVFMKRATHDNLDLYIDPSNATLLNANQLTFDFEAGVDASLIYQLNPCTGIEARYLGLDNHEGSPVLFDLPAVGNSQVLTSPPTITVGPSANLRATHGSNLQTAEISLRRSCHNGLNLTAGFRYARLDERLTILEPVVNGTQMWRTKNDLYGFQLGVDGLIYDRCKLRIDGFAKAGIYENVGDLTVNVTYPPPFTLNSFSSSSDNDTAFLAEIGIFASHNVTSNLSVRGGYQLLWLTGIATAPDQVSATGNIFAGGNIPSSIISEGDAFYHGFNVGLEFIY